MSQKSFSCPVLNCQTKFSRQYNLNRHIERKHLAQNFIEKCLLCGQIFQSCEEIQKHYEEFHKPNAKFYLKDTAFRKTVETYRYNYDANVLNFQFGQKKVMSYISQLLRLEAGKKTLIKTSLIYICEMIMEDHVGEKVTSTLIPFRAQSFLTNANSLRTLNQNISRSFKMQEHEMEQFTNSGSNWVFNRAVAFDVEISAMRPILMGHNTDDKIDIKNIKNNRFLFNPSNKDQKCFLYCVFNLLEKRFPFIKTFSQFEKTLNLACINFPISIQHIKLFCEKNQHLDLKINILYRSIDGNIFPYEFGIGKGKIKLNLLLIRRSNDLKVINHFVRIIDANKFLRQTYNKNMKKSYKRVFTCLNCLNIFSLQNTYKMHKKYCFLNKPRKEIVSTKKHVEFVNFKNQHPCDYIAFVDFECILPKTTMKCDECMHLRCKCDRSYTHVMSEQFPIAYSLLILDSNNKIIHENTYSGENAANKLIDHLLEQEKQWISNLFSQFHELKLSSTEQKTFNNSQHCYLCKRDFEALIKCRDHCHFTGKYLGAACQSCNLERRKQQKLKIFMHNGSRYDFHFIIKALNNRKKDINNIYILPYNGENFRSIQFNSFLFLDSMAFLQSSLAQLSEDLAKTDNPYSILRQTYLVKKDGRFNKKRFNLVLGKSFFPYEYW
jgi:hypothetical protein